MKKLVFFIFIVLLIFSNRDTFCQSGWFPQNSNTTNDLRSVSFANANTGWAVGFNNTVLKTTNGGNNWFQLSLTGSYGYISCKFLDENTGWITGSNAIILKTTNGGSSWINQSYSGAGRLFNSSFPTSQIGYVIGDYGLIIKTTNGGQNWQQKTVGITNNLIDVKFLNQNTGWIVGDGGIILKTADGGNTWVLQSSGTTYNLQDCFFANENTGWATADGGVIIKTTNSGNTWTTKYITGSSIWLGCVSFPNVNTGYVVGGIFSSGSNPVLLKSTNGGENWFSQTSPVTAWFGSCYFINENTGWAVGKPGMIIKTVTGGLNTPAPPVLIYPGNGATNISFTPAMTWNNSTGATRYTIQISPVNNFSVIIDSATITVNQHIVPTGKLSISTTYFWRVNASSSLGTSPWSEVWYFSTQTTGIYSYNSEIPSDYKLYSNYPNPFNSATKIRFDLPKKSYTSLIVYNSLGKTVETLVNTELKEGRYEYTWSAEKYNSGVYFVRLVSDKFVETRKMVLLK